ncbi:TIGR04282 family arsenosugar biosynthesis glycosyltransferase [Flavobacteriaceae bacterium]|nr:TIGR04282 family arsenosugar biosynthesis glycosyltransferase [Flavobacteriaceae bacterium]
MKSLVLVFAKTPVLGSLKTRLAKTVGDEKALWVYQQLLKKTSTVLECLTHDVLIFFYGEAPNLFGSSFMRYPKIQQQGKDLGARMEHAFAWGFAKGYTKIVIIGTDIWELNAQLLDQAFESLDSFEVVLGPAQDGGYYLLGCKTLLPSLFKQKKWGAATVFRDTINDLKDYSVAFLEEKNDIDHYSDLLQFPELLNLMNQHFNERKD